MGLLDHKFPEPDPKMKLVEKIKEDFATHKPAKFIYLGLHAEEAIRAQKAYMVANYGIKEFDIRILQK